MEESSEGIRLDPGESYQSVYKIRAHPCGFGLEGDERLKPTAFRNVKELDLFSELLFTWYSQPSQAASSLRDVISCSMPSPLLTLVDTPLKVTLVNVDKSIDTNGVLYQPIPLTYEVANQGDHVIESEVTIEEIDDFYIGGELKTFLPLMPGETYSFYFNVIPLQIGRLALPRFTL